LNVSHEESSKPTPDSKGPPEDERPDSGAAPGRPTFEDDPAEMAVDVDSVANSLAADLDSLRAELEDAQNRALRSSAELENYRRRANRQMEDERRYANLDMLRDLLPIWDNMGRAVEAAKNAGEAETLLEGFKMVLAQLESVFERYHCVKIDATGEPFDPNLHEAISQMPSADHPSGTVLHVTQIGFRLHERVVRPCQVVVSAAPSSPEPGQDHDADDVDQTPDDQE
jgi:molecular chaperone GrpE